MGGVATLAKPMTARPATMADAASIMVMGRRMHQESPRYRNRPYDEGKVAHLTAAAVSEGGSVRAFVLEVDGLVVGMMAATTATDFFGTTKAAIDVLLYIEPAHRRGGAARLMIQECEAWARANWGVTRMRVGATTGIADEAVAGMYERLGYQRIGIVLEKEL